MVLPLTLTIFFIFLWLNSGLMWQTDSLGMVPPGFVIKTTAGCTCKRHWTMAQNSLFMTIILLIQNTTTSTLNEIPNVAYLMLNLLLQMAKWLNRAYNTSIGKWQRAPSCEWRALGRNVSTNQCVTTFYVAN